MTTEPQVFGMVCHLRDLLSREGLTLSLTTHDDRSDSAVSEPIALQAIKHFEPKLEVQLRQPVRFVPPKNKAQEERLADQRRRTLIASAGGNLPAHILAPMRPGDEDIDDEPGKKTNRFWYDCAFEIVNPKEPLKSILVPINVKITQGNQPDNTGSKRGLYYALKGCMPDHVTAQIGWDAYFDALKYDTAESFDRDYYFIVINKHDTRKVIAQSLRRLPKLTSNGNNLPFQCKWKDNAKPVARTYKEAEAFLIGTLGESCHKGAAADRAYSKRFGDYQGVLAGATVLSRVQIQKLALEFACDVAAAGP